MTSVDLKYKAFTDATKIVGCFGPCTKMTSAQWEGWRQKLAPTGTLQPESP